MPTEQQSKEVDTMAMCRARALTDSPRALPRAASHNGIWGEGWSRMTPRSGHQLGTEELMRWG